MDPVNVLIIASKELRDSMRNRWFALYTVAFSLLALGLASMSLAGVSATGFGGFGKTSAGLINLVLFIVPLMALTAGASSVASDRERGTLQHLLAQPVARIEVAAGKYLGLAGALFASLAIGFGLSAAVMAWRGGGADAGRYFTLVLLSFTLALTMLSVGMLISTLAPRGATAMGAAIFAWLVFVLLGDFGLMSSAIAFKLQPNELFSLALINPLQVFKMASIRSINASIDVLGPTGLYAMRTYGPRLTLIFAGVLAAWIIAPLGLATVVFSRKSFS